MALVMYPASREKLLTNVFGKSAKETFLLFCTCTSQHGYKFVALPKRTLLERCLWVLVIIICAAAIGVYAWLLHQLYTNETYTIVTDTTHFPLWEYYTPAITLCNVNKISKSLADKYIKLFNNFNDTTYNSKSFRQDFRYLYHLINFNEHADFEKLAMFQKVLDNNNVTASQLLNLIAPNCDVVLRCHLKGDIKRCWKLFQQTMTAYGHCCSFNYFAINKTVRGRTEPSRGSTCGYRNSFQILLDVNRDDYELYDIFTSGFSAYIHYPYDYLDSGTEFMILSEASSNMLSLFLTAMDTSSYMLSYSPQYRNCYLREEKKLKMFQVYTRGNCVVECKMEIVNKACGCIPFYYYVGDVCTYTICNMNQVECIYKTSKNISNADLHNECGCLEDCIYTTYQLEYSGGGVSKNAIINSNTFATGINIVNQSVVRIYYQSIGFIHNVRQEQNNFTSFLALVGGTLGLFNGTSILSILEMLYFFIIRLSVTFTKNKKDKKQKKPKTKKIFVLENSYKINRDYI